MKTLCILFVLFFALGTVYCSEKQIHPFLQNVMQQTGYKYSLMRDHESRHDIVEYNADIDLQLTDGIKSLMIKQSHVLTTDSTENVDVNLNVTEACLNDTSQMFKDIRNNTEYAIEMLDTDGKPGSGIKHGDIYWLGNKEECAQANSVKFRGQMCNIITNGGFTQFKLFLTIGVCFPDSCTEMDITIIAYKALSKIKLMPIVVSCPETLKYSNGDITALVVCSIIGLAVVIGTIADIVYMYSYQEKDNDTINVRAETPPNYATVAAPVNYGSNDASERMGLLSNVPMGDVVYAKNSGRSYNAILRKILISFSLITNTKKLLHTSTASGSLTAINGMRVLSMWWVILGHTFAFNYNMTDNLLDFANLLKRFSFQCIMNGTYSVDTFFFMSGLLVAYVTMKKLKDDGKINWLMFYFHRFWRLTPVYAVAILIWTTLYRHWVWNGSFSTLSTKSHPSTFDYCDKYWWTNILYINNFHPSLGNIGKQCMGWGWYLANDMQFYVISPVFLLFLHKKKWIGHGLLSFSLFACIASRIITADYYGMRLPGMNTVLKHGNESWAQSSPLYNKPYTRIAPYIVGIWLGYLLVINNNRVRLGKARLLIMLIGWCVAIAIGLSVVYGLYDFYKDYPSTKIGGEGESLFYIGTSRLAWSLALAWVIFVCAVGYGGPVNSFLSWKVWAPLGRLTYCAYIVHPAVIFYLSLNMEKPLHYTDLVMIQVYIAGLVVSYCVAFVLSMTVEAPMLSLEKVLFNR